MVVVIMVLVMAVTVVVVVVTMVVSINRGNRSLKRRTSPPHLPTVLDTYMVVGNLCPHVIKFID